MKMYVKDATGEYRPATRDEAVEGAKTALASKWKRGGVVTSPQSSVNFLTVRIGNLGHEVFSVLWLDNRHRIIEFEELSRGTIDGASVYPREVAKRALETNAAACILAHNHPSGITEPSQADMRITQRLKEALELLSVRVLDHIIIGDGSYSFAEHGVL